MSTPTQFCPEPVAGFAEDFERLALFSLPIPSLLLVITPSLLVQPL